MYMAFIDGYDQVMAFHSNKAVAKRLAVARKKRLCGDDLAVWSWKNCKDYFGANVYLIKDGVVIDGYTGCQID